MTETPAPLGDLIGPVIRDLARSSNQDVTRWLRQVDRLRGCTDPIRLTGESTTLHGTTGELLHTYTTRDEPHGQLLIRCGNRRASRCPACAETYRQDTFHLIRAGLLGGTKGVPDIVRTHPKVLRHPHRPVLRPRPPRPRQGRHGTPATRAAPARLLHPPPEGDPTIGQPLDPDTYDYPGHVLWNAHAAALWHRFTIYLRQHLAAATGLTRKEFADTTRVSFAKVAEYQARASSTSTPSSASTAATAAPSPPAGLGHPRPARPPPSTPPPKAVRLPPRRSATDRLTWGTNRRPPDPTAGLDDKACTEAAVAGYIAKYATKAAETSGTLDRRVTPPRPHPLHTHGVTDTPRR